MHYFKFWNIVIIQYIILYFLVKKKKKNLTTSIIWVLIAQLLVNITDFLKFKLYKKQIYGQFFFNIVKTQFIIRRLYYRI